MGAEKIYDKMPETLDFMQVLSIFIHSSFTDSGNRIYAKDIVTFMARKKPTSEELILICERRGYIMF